MFSNLQFKLVIFEIWSRPGGSWSHRAHSQTRKSMHHSWLQHYRQWGLQRRETQSILLIDLKVTCHVALFFGGGKAHTISWCIDVILVNSKQIMHTFLETLTWKYWWTSEFAISFCCLASAVFVPKWKPMLSLNAAIFIDVAIFPQFLTLASNIFISKQFWSSSANTS